MLALYDITGAQKFHSSYFSRPCFPVEKKNQKYLDKHASTQLLL